jgi:Protein of unknown function (DUF1553)/Protein of unknown function (DUF1549)/Planctomycete cytochrome C
MKATIRLSVVMLVGGMSAAAFAAEPVKLTRAESDFFETRVRPVLVENCYKCHSLGAEKIKGGLTLDSRDGVMKGGDTGPAVVPGNLEKSLLIKAIRYTDKDFAMPPADKKLPENVIRDLEQWVKMGAPDPRTEGVSAKAMYEADMEKAKKHWAYKPVVKPAVPEPADPDRWAQNAVDKFILASLKAKGLANSPRADKVTLIRRATFDLHGLPPTQKEVDEFVNDQSANAWPNLIDRLLASPRYGERWGRHWLDLAKYADTTGPSNNGRDNRYLWSWTYRDWVIRAMNEDLPYDQFILKQIAADKLNLDNPRDLAAMGYITLGNRFGGNNANDVIDDRIDLIGKSTMALTLACARCHDHKFDPIPTKDYYSLHGVFNSCNEPKEGPTLEPIQETTGYTNYLRQLAEREAAVAGFEEKIERDLIAETRGRVGDYLLAVHEDRNFTNNQARLAYYQQHKLRQQAVNAWKDFLKGKTKQSSVFGPWIAFEALSEAEFATKGKELAAKFAANTDKVKPLNPNVAKMFYSAPANLGQVAVRYTTLFASVTKQWEGMVAGYESRKKSSSAPGAAPLGLPDKDLEQLRLVLYDKGSPTFLDERRVRDFIQRDNTLRGQHNQLIRTVNDVKANHPFSPVRAHVMYDNAKPKDSYVMIKGNPGSRGPVVPRQFPEIVAGPDRQPFKNGSGRLELAQAIVSKDNPLTARVAANRVWLHHFGEGLVPTPDDFGVRSEPPTHPEMLDYLAAKFVEDGWSLKSLHRLMMLSATYQQSSEENPRFAQIDPGNKYYWQMNRRRLDFEALRDTILYIGGKLDTTAGGPGVPLDREPYPTRRTVYGYLDRARLPNMHLAFDFVNPDLTTGKRSQTIVPQQALFMMNSPLVVEQARNLTLRRDFKGMARAEDRIKLLYKLTYQREPSEIELDLALDYVRGETSVTATNTGALAWEYGYGEIDPTARQVKGFVQLPTFRGNAWVVGDRQMKAGPVRLTAKGGQPGNGMPHAAIRRWTARRDGMISIDGMFGQQSKDATDAVRGWIMSSGTGLVGTYSAQKSQTPTKLPKLMVKRGDTIDFVVAGKGSFNWAPVIKYLGGGKAGEVAEWSAEKDFGNRTAPKHMEPWEKLAQVLLETNEMTFIN